MTRPAHWSSAASHGKSLTASPFRPIVGSTLVVVALVLQSCDRSPIRPQPSASPSSSVTVVGLELRAPDEIPLGGSVQLTANAVKSDASFENVTSQVQWSLSNNRLLEISAAGVASGLIKGESEITARYEGRTAFARVFVLPAGTFRLGGRVTENGEGVRDVTVTVIAGGGQGLVARTRDSGDYVLYGVSGQLRLQAKREGYVDVIRDVDVTTHTTHGFELVPERPVSRLAGTYTLTVTAGCRSLVGTLPDAVRNRTYTATISQDQRWLNVTLTAASFIMADGHGDRFGGFVDANERVTFAISDVGYDDYDNRRCYRCDLVERLTANTALVVGGNVAASATPSGISGILFGTFWVSEGATLPLTQFSSQCTGVHDFELRRR